MWDFSLAENEFDETLFKFESLEMKLRTVCPHRNPVQKNLDGLLIKIF